MKYSSVPNSRLEISVPKVLDPCMFCGELPCVCNGPKVKKKKEASKSATKVATNSKPETDRQLNSTALAPLEVKESEFVVNLPEREDFARAIRALSEAGMLADRRLVEVADQVSIRADAWRAKCRSIT